MKPSRHYGVCALSGWLHGTQLRLKVMAGVVAVTLVALAGFDFAAVSIMRHYLFGQTDKNLQTALTVTRGQLPALLPGAHRPSVAGPMRQRAILGDFDITYLPDHGRRVQLEAGVGYRMPVRMQSVPVNGGSLVAGTGLDQVSETIVQIELIVLFGSIAVVLLIAGGVFAVLRRGMRPIEAMAAQADLITAGDLAHRVTPHDPQTEVGRLSAALNGMLSRIEAAMDEREASQEQMRRFFADASHELRTPLASLRANAELYQQGALSAPGQVDEVMRRIALETRRMGTLVDDMLGLARLGQHPDRVRAPVDVTALVSACAERARSASPGRVWQVRVAQDLTIAGDEELLRRAIDNLLTNVIVHTPAGTVGTITATAADGRVAIEVSDDGPGVPADKLPHIFERFYRAGARPGRPGSGLGLAIAAEVAAAHGGTAAAEPATPHGLRITLTLPVRTRTFEVSGPHTPQDEVSGPHTSDEPDRQGAVSLARTGRT